MNTRIIFLALACASGTCSAATLDFDGYQLSWDSARWSTASVTSTGVVAADITNTVVDPVTGVPHQVWAGFNKDVAEVVFNAPSFAMDVEGPGALENASTSFLFTVTAKPGWSIDSVYFQGLSGTWAGTGGASGAYAGHATALFEPADRRSGGGSSYGRETEYEGVRYGSFALTANYYDNVLDAHEVRDPGGSVVGLRYDLLEGSSAVALLGGASLSGAAFGSGSSFTSRSAATSGLTISAFQVADSASAAMSIAAAVPEPTSIAMLLAGLLTLGAIGRRRL